MAKCEVLAAEMLGVRRLSAHVKATVVRNTAAKSQNGHGSPSADDVAAAAAFDREHGGLAAAFERGTLPAAYFARAAGEA